MGTRFECGPCVVRSWRWSDLGDLARRANTRAVADQMLRFPYPYGRRHAAAFLGFVRLRRALGRPETHFAIESNRELAGGIGLRMGSEVEARIGELSYWLGESFWGRGLATAAVRALTPYAFLTLRLERVRALPFADNRASGRVLEKAGFERESLQRGSAVRRGVVHDQWVYVLTRDAFVGSAVRSPGGAAPY
jgi:RimJ/RimL family protein N-acetyltransferase